MDWYRAHGTNHWENEWWWTLRLTHCRITMGQWYNPATIAKKNNTEGQDLNGDVTGGIGGCHYPNFVVTGWPGGCRYDNLRCRQLRQSWHDDNPRISNKIMDIKYSHGVLDVATNNGVTKLVVKLQPLEQKPVPLWSPWTSFVNIWLRHG